VKQMVVSASHMLKIPAEVPDVRGDLLAATQSCIRWKIQMAQCGITDKVRVL